ncbi:MAG: hypothetical protein P8P74_15955 [Crocinitomicaceae bacterium]|nr:hypothetical protein [Crocinitomicaceae bacterium]
MAAYNYKESEYKKKLRKEAELQIEKSKENEKEAVISRKTFLDESNSLEVRLAAAKNMGNFKEEDDIDKALKIVRNKEENHEIRSKAFSGISKLVLSRQDVMQEAIEALKSGDGEGKVALAALAILQLAEISAPRMLQPNAADYKDALRTAIDHSNKDLRGSALEILAMDKDEYAQRKLINSLESESDELIEPEVAVQLLAYDLHADHLDVLKKVAENSKSVIAKREAIRNLGSDKSAKELLEKTLKDSDEDPETRHAAATALYTLHPELAAKHSKDVILEDAGADKGEELKVALLNSLLFLQEGSSEGMKLFTESVADVDDFELGLDKLKNSAESKDLRDMIEAFEKSKKK